jgi:glycosyltransferase involved in cell wall biosynthesis
MKKIKKSKLSICMIVKNEALILERCLESTRAVADELIIVDTGSNDSTIQIAKKYGAIIVSSEWKNDFSYSRNISIQHAQCEWILWIDADDIIPQKSIPEINALKKEKANKVYGMVIKNQKPNGTGSIFLQARMFPNHPSVFFEQSIHEQVMPSALRSGLKLINTQIVIEHYGYSDPDDIQKKAKRNISFLKKEIDKKQNDPVLIIEIADSYSILNDNKNAQYWYEQLISEPLFHKRFPIIVSQAYMGLGNICNCEEKYGRGEQLFGKAQDLCPERTDTLYCTAVSQEMLGEPEKAIQTLQKILMMKYMPLQVGIDYRETKLKAYLRLARLYNDFRHDSKIKELCQRALRDFEEQPEIYNMTATGYFQLNNLMEALHLFEKSIKIRKEGNIDAYIGLCMIYIRAERKNIALQTMEQIRPVFRSYPRYWAATIIFSIDEHIPENIDKNLIEKEEKYLRDMYRLSLK